MRVVDRFQKASPLASFQIISGVDLGQNRQALHSAQKGGDVLKLGQIQSAALAHWGLRVNSDRLCGRFHPFGRYESKAWLTRGLSRLLRGRSRGQRHPLHSKL